MTEKRLADIDLKALCQQSTFTPSPAAWEDQILYFLLVDRFSDGQEKDYIDNQGQRVTSGATPRFTAADQGNALLPGQDASQWQAAGGGWVNGNLAGLESKLGYLKRLGVTAIWISPIFKQVSFQPTYHGYGIQNFLDVDPHFGTRDDLRHLVDTAHRLGLYVILDIIFNHSGNVFGYDADRYPARDAAGQWFMDPRWDRSSYRVQGFRSSSGQPDIPFGPVDLARHPQAWPDGAVWPAEFQEPGTFTCKGRISSWDYYPEYLEGDFCDLKDIHHGQGDVEQFQPSPALKYLCEVYKFWIAFADLDGYRIDTVKHMEPGAVRYFASVVHEFTQGLGKENFYLIGEITGGRERAFDTLEQTGLDAALGIDDIPDKLEYLVKGYRNPADYFNLFRNSLLVNKESHVWFRNRVVTMFDDHDQVRKGENKARFCADPGADQALFNVLAVNTLTLGIPCIYYGSEQYFAGQGKNDRFLREAVFGGTFGAFYSQGRHFFNEDSPAFREFARLARLRREKIALRRGRQYLRPISGDGEHFGLPEMVGGQIRSVVPWSRLFNDSEILCALNTDIASARTAWVTLDNSLHAAGGRLTCLYSTDPAQIGTSAAIENRNGKAVLLTVPAHGFVIYE